jgi:hypothetical protein
MSLNTTTISISGNIALYPSLSINPDGMTAIVWYEYSSRYETKQSDIWFSSMDKNGGWSKPINLSQGVSYNNGPSLVWIHSNNCWRCSWHSWRPPGKEPFIEGGDITNLWYIDISLESLISMPGLLLPGVLNTEYASLAFTDSKDMMTVLYYNRIENQQYLANMHNQSPLSYEIESLPKEISNGQHGDIAIDYKGIMWITFVGNDGHIYLTSKRKDCEWTQPSSISDISSSKYMRPKISICSQNKLWIACHTNNWGSRVTRYKVKTTTEQLEIYLESDQTPGNHCWACNTILIRNGENEKLFSFGPDAFIHQINTIVVTEGHSLFNNSRGFGFDHKPRSQLRELGNELTKGLFYDDKPAVFRINVPVGIYEIEIGISSWIAPVDGMQVSFNAEILESEKRVKIYDKVHLLQVDADMKVCTYILSDQQNYDQNRPSKVMHNIYSNQKSIAWTSYGPNNIKVVYTSFAEAELDKYKVN